ncbi:hypothetical protein [Halomonas sp. GD1P12]|uniref:hypothetical protein n=1 Tax=Halomonas sp. GD1P12 TaxID=2982691 RepID=UPI0021E4459F|nr:hypothetical protein [Halomonas sp. GD1P12]UYG01360.1 hypothetical protein OCT39_07340 [Halomonas sp. GD1P12]
MNTFRPRRLSAAQRIAGAIIALVGLVTLLLGLLMGYALIGELSDSLTEGALSLAIFFSLLTGLGTIALAAGWGLARGKRERPREVWVPWQALMLAGVLITTAMLAFMGHALWHGSPMGGAAAKGVSMLMGLGLAFLASGFYRRKKRGRNLFR